MFSIIDKVYLYVNNPMVIFQLNLTLSKQTSIVLIVCVQTVFKTIENKCTTITSNNTTITIQHSTLCTYAQPYIIYVTIVNFFQLTLYEREKRMTSILPLYCCSLD